MGRLRVLGFATACLLALPAPAVAHHWGDDSEQGQEQEQGQGPWWAPEDEPDEAVAEGVEVPELEPAEVGPAPVQELFPDVEDVGQPSAPAPGRPVAPAQPQLPLVRTAMVPGTKARMRPDGRAAIPRGAPKRVRTVIAALNRIVGKPYKWGGGHARLIDSGYDCSGSVSYGLIGAGLLRSPMVSGSFVRWGRAGAGRHLTVYANRGHMYAEIAGLRLDTSPVGDPAGRKGVRWRPVIGKRRGFAVRHPAGL
jgi:hypothetical protein